MSSKIFNKRSVFLLTMVLFAGGLFSASPVFAQRTLSLNDALGIALKQSYTIKIQRFMLNSQQLRTEAAIRRQKTNVDAFFTAPSWNRGIQPLQLDDGTWRYLDTKTIQTSGALTVSQPVMFLNGNLSLVADYGTSDNKSERQPGIWSITQNWTSSLSLRYTQPLFQPNTQRLNFENDKRDLTRQEKTFESRQNEIYLKVMTDYYNLVKSKGQLEIERETVEQNETTLTNTMNKYRAGITAEVDALKAQVDYDLARSQFKISELDYKSLTDQFKLYIGMPLDEEIDVENVLDVINIIEIDEEKAFLEALERDADLFSSELEIINRKNDVIQTKASRKLKADLSLNYGLNESDPITSNLSETMFRDYNQTNRAVINVTVPIFDWGRHRRSVEISNINLKSSELSLENSKISIRRSIQSDIDGINNAEERMSIQERSQQLAQQSYDISVQRYDIGEIDSEALFQANQRLKNAKESVLSAKISYLLAIATLNKDTYWDFINNRPLKDTVDSFAIR